MNLEQLLARIAEIAAAIINMTNQLNALHGHKAEAEHWVSQLKAADEPKSETQVETPAEPVVE